MAAENNVQGRVIVQFVVATNGTVGNAKILRSVSPELDAEAMRVLSIMPKWKPGMQKGKAVNVKYTLPVSFRLPSDKKDKKVADSPKSGIKVVGVSSEKKTDASADDNQKKVVIKTTSSVNTLINVDVNGKSSAKKNPLIIVDGKEVSPEEFAKIVPEQIESVTVLKDESARARYGDKGMNSEGIIEVKLKKQ